MIKSIIFLQLNNSLNSQKNKLIMKFRDWWRNYKSIGIFCIIFILFLVCFTIWNIFQNNKNQEIKNEEWINISEFSNTLEIQKTWKLLSYPEITVLSETDWEIISLNVSEWDIVEQRDILMQIWNEYDNKETIDKLDKQISQKYVEFYENMDEYNEFELKYWPEISDLEKNILESNIILQIATDTNDTKTINEMQNKIYETSQKLKLLKNERDNLKNKITNLENEINSVNKESLNLYYEFDKQTPRASIQWVVWNIYVQEWDKIKNWDKLCTIIDNIHIPEISVWLDFDEYVLTQDLTWVIIITENENRWNSYYEWEIYTRNPKINDEWEYILTVRILEEVSDLILSDENTKITVVFNKDFPTIWIPENCFTKISKDNWILTLRDGEIITQKEIWIKNKWNNWINIDNLWLYSLENEEKKDEMNLYTWENFEVLCNLE